LILSLSLSLSLSLTNSITTQPAKLIDPKEVQIFPPPNATKVMIHNNAQENNCGVIPKSFGKIMVPIWTSLNSRVARSWRRLRRADPYADNCPCFSFRTPPARPSQKSDFCGRTKVNVFSFKERCILIFI
jgi:hypothetical protein